jgi:predicted nucleic acid-binding protein
MRRSARLLEEGHLYRSPILEFEVLYSARNAREHEELTEELQALRPLELSEAVVGAALRAQAELARHREAADPLRQHRRAISEPPGA